MQGDIQDHESLVAALKQVDVVISTVGGAQLRDQLKLITAIKEVGHITVCQSLVHDLKPLLNFVRCRDWSAEQVSIQKNIMAGLIILPSKHVILQPDTALIYDTMLCTKVFYQINIFHTGIQIFLWSLIYCPFFLCLVQRFLPSEFGNDPERSVRLKPTDAVFQGKVKIRNAIKAAGIPYTFVNSNSFASYFLASLGQRDLTTPPRDKLTILGDGNAKGLSWAHPLSAACTTLASRLIIWGILWCLI